MGGDTTVAGALSQSLACRWTGAGLGSPAHTQFWATARAVGVSSPWVPSFCQALEMGHQTWDWGFLGRGAFRANTRQSRAERGESVFPFPAPHRRGKSLSVGVLDEQASPLPCCHIISVPHTHTGCLPVLGAPLTRPPRGQADEHSSLLCVLTPRLQHPPAERPET